MQRHAPVVLARDKAPYRLTLRIRNHRFGYRPTVRTSKEQPLALGREGRAFTHPMQGMSLSENADFPFGIFAREQTFEKSNVGLPAVWIHHKLVNMQEENSANDEGKRSFIELARRAQIIDCAIETIAELGFTRASLAKIAERAQVSPGAILYHFGSKKALIQEVWNHLAEKANAFISARTQEPDPATALRTRIAAEVALHAANPTYRRTGARIALARRVAEADAPEIESSWQEQRCKAYQRIMEWGQSTGIFRTFDIPVMIRAITTATSTIHFLPEANVEFELSTYGDTLVDLFDRATRSDTK